eukprot:2626430-Prymnesium_polylepis.1
MHVDYDPRLMAVRLEVHAVAVVAKGTIARWASLSVATLLPQPTPQLTTPLTMPPLATSLLRHDLAMCSLRAWMPMLALVAAACL